MITYEMHEALHNAADSLGRKGLVTDAVELLVLAGCVRRVEPEKYLPREDCPFCVMYDAEIHRRV